MDLAPYRANLALASLRRNVITPAVIGMQSWHKSFNRLKISILIGSEIPIHCQRCNFRGGISMDRADLQLLYHQVPINDTTLVVLVSGTVPPGR